MTGPFQKLFRKTAGATAELEEVLFHGPRPDSPYCSPSSKPDAWQAEFPDLKSLLTDENAYPHKGRRLSVCIATEDVVGPVRNGGIGTTYSSVAESLAQDGHDVTLLYLRGNFVEQGNIAHSVKRYAEKGVTFIPVPDYFSIDNIPAPQEPWLLLAYKLLRFLLDHRFDAVHLSEWRGAGYLSLLAKHQGLAFQDTLFVVKASSPWLWNRTYSSQLLAELDELKKIHAERRSIELADIVISGSTHLLRWMLSRGYQLPPGRTFCQPNLLLLDSVTSSRQPQNPPGKRVAIDEVVFFGRLEARKGLLPFCHSIDRLIRSQVPLPNKVTFLGKPGARLDASVRGSNLKFLAAATKHWPMTVSFLTDYNQQKAVAYLSGGNRLAVMPSFIENSSLAVYEAVLCGVPFIASSAGGNPELIDPRDREQVLCDAHPIALSEKIATAVSEGAYVARPSFDNDNNIATWRKFHQALADGLAPVLARRARQESPGVGSPAGTVAVCIYHAGDVEALKATLASVERQQEKPDEIIIAADGSSRSIEGISHLPKDITSVRLRVIDTADSDAGLSFNLAAAAAGAPSHLLFLWEGMTLLPPALRVFRRVSNVTGAAVINSFFELREAGAAGERRQLKAPFAIGPAQPTLQSLPHAQPIYVSREAFLKLGGFTTDYRVIGYDRELLAKANAMGMRCETIPFCLAIVKAFGRKWLRQRGYNESAQWFRSIRPYYANAPLGLQNLVLFAQGVSAKNEASGLGTALVTALSRSYAFLAGSRHRKHSAETSEATVSLVRALDSQK